MKKLFIAALVAASPSVFAQGYVGAVAALTRLNDACEPLFRCGSSNAGGFKVFGGAYLPAAQTLNLGVAKVNRVEVGAMRFGKISSSGVGVKYAWNDDDEVYVPSDVTVKRSAQADAISGAVVMEVALADQLTLATKLGLAYVSATAAIERNGRRFDSKTQSSVQPYAGLGLEYALPGDVRLQGGVDWTRYRVAGRSGSATQLGLGASVAF